MVAEIDRTSIIQRASGEKDLPPAGELVKTLLEIERESKKIKETLTFDRLVGNWRLRFITGTKKARGRAGIVLGSGRYLPRWVGISIGYDRSETDENRGTIVNRVTLGGLKLTVSGPARCYPDKRLLAFDFTRMTVTLFGATLYSGYIRNGEESEKNFYGDSIQKQAFFAFFMIIERAVAARGRGGGLALWVRED